MELAQARAHLHHTYRYTLIRDATMIGCSNWSPTPIGLSEIRLIVFPPMMLPYLLATIPINNDAQVKALEDIRG